MKDVIQDIADKVERDRAAIARMVPEDLQAAARELGHPIQPGDIFHIDDVVFKAVAVPQPWEQAAAVALPDNPEVQEQKRIIHDRITTGTCTPNHVLIFKPEHEDEGDEVLRRLQERLERDVERIRAGEFINPYIQMDDSDLLRARMDELEGLVASMRPMMTASERRLYGVPRCGLGPGDASDPWTEIHNTVATMHGMIERQDKIITALLKHCDLKIEDVDALYGQVIGR
jgi:hypothetical protein